MYDLRAIRKTYFEAYAQNGGNTVEAKRLALAQHNVPEEDYARVASQLSGSRDWDKISEIRTKPVRETTSHRRKKHTTPEFTLPHTSVLLAECAALAHEANEDVCPID